MKLKIIVWADTRGGDEEYQKFEIETPHPPTIGDCLIFSVGAETFQVVVRERTLEIVQADQSVILTVFGWSHPDSGFHTKSPYDD